MRKLTTVLISCIFIFNISCLNNSDTPDPNDDGTNNNGNTEQPENIAKKITAYKLSKELNNLESDIVGIINEKNKTITLASNSWIDKIETLIPSFETKGNASIANIEQLPEETEVNFTNRTVLYKVTGDDGKSADYTVNFVSPQTTGLPVIKIDIEGGENITEKTEEYFAAEILVNDYKKPEYNLKKTTGIRGRGNNTWRYDKKPYRIKFDENTSFFGLGAEKSWVLLANFLDPSLLMSAVAFELGHRFQLPFTNHDFPCELFINGEYRGHYTLTEQVEVNPSRVNVDKENGFLIEIDKYYDDTPKFKTKVLQLPVMVKSPKASSMTEIQWVQDYIQEFEYEFMQNTNITTSDYDKYIDINSLIDFMLVNEITNNQDIALPNSLYIHKDANSKMYFGPIWDFDWGFGKDVGAGIFIYFKNPNKILFSPYPNDDDKLGTKFFSRFLQDPVFQERYKNRWNELKESRLLELDDFIDRKTANLDHSQQLNFELWNNKLVYKEQIDKMRKWLEEHIKYIDEKINNDFK